MNAALTSWLTPQKRSCGDCKACCTVIAVQELGKSFMVPCEHECRKGCGIYGRHPKSCQQYECAWLAGAGSSGDRPDRSGFLVHNEVELGTGTIWIEVYQTKPGDWNMNQIESFLVWLKNHSLAMRQARGIRFISYGQQRNTCWSPNTKKYPNGGNTPDAGKFGKEVWTTTDGFTYLLEAPFRKGMEHAETTSQAGSGGDATDSTGGVPRLRPLPVIT